MVGTNGTWSRKFLNENSLLTLCFIGKETVDLGNGSVEGHDSETVVCRVHDEVLAHDGQANEAEVTTRSRSSRSADIDASETATKVSMMDSSQRCELSCSREVEWVRASVGEGVCFKGGCGWESSVACMNTVLSSPEPRSPP